MRLCTIVVPRFCHDGLVVTGDWLDLDWSKAPEPVRAAVVQYHGRFVRTHPADEAKWPELGFQLVENRLVPVLVEPAPPAPPADPAPAAPTRKK